MERIETILTERAESLGVTILGNNGVTGIAAQDDHGVTVETAETRTFRGKWLVGYDGGRSIVRKAAAVNLIGTEARFTGYAVKCDLDYPEKLTPGFQVTNTGMYIFGPPNTLHLVDFDGVAFDRTNEITKEHIQRVLNRITGTTDVKITDIHLASSFTDRSKQATSYRKGRILLAGDAAHNHSPLGAQGLNVGLGDAMNIGWKLAAIIQQESKSEGPLTDPTLLDTYESERHPVAAWVLEWTRAQVSTLQPDLYGAAMHSLIRDLIETTDGTNLFIDRIWGLSQRYKLGDTKADKHSLVACSAPDFELHDDSRLGSKLEGGRGLLVDFEGNVKLKELVVGGKYEGRVEYIAIGAKDKRGLQALLIRPDGIVAWVAEAHVVPDVDAAKSSLERWFRS